MAEHCLTTSGEKDKRNYHCTWDNSLEPRLEIESGDTVTFECREASDAQVTPESEHESLGDLDFSRVHPLTGPVLVKGAQPGHTLQVDILELRHGGWGWNGHLPGFGLLPDDFDFPYLQHWRLEEDTCYFRDSSQVKVPFEPFCGVMGVALAEAGQFPTLPPRINGGNIDIRGLTVGARLYLPVQVAGALFSTGDCHSAQGDGEVSGTGIETPMTVTLRFKLRQDFAVPELQFETPSPLTRADSAGYYCTTAHGEDLLVNSQKALRYMIDHLERSTGLSRSEAYCLCSAAADLKISEIVDAPNWIVSCYLPKSVWDPLAR